MDKSKRLGKFYVPGIISLTLLPLIFFSFANKEIKRRTLTILPIFIADTNLLKTYLPFLESNRPFLPTRKYADINFTGNIDIDKIKLSFAQIRINEILSQNDSISGLHFKFGDNSQYGTFVNTIDILRFEKAKTYIALENNLWFLYVPPDTTVHH